MKSLLSFAIAVAVLIAGMAGLDYAWAEPADASQGVAVGWADWIRAIWPILVVVVGAIGSGLYLGLAMRFPSVSAFEKLKQRVDKLEREDGDKEGRLKRVEEICVAAPTRIELQEDIAKLGQRMSGMEGKMHGVGQQLRTIDNYLRTLIERGLAN